MLGANHMYGSKPGINTHAQKIVNGLHLYSTSLTSGNAKRFAILPHIHRFMHTLTQRRRCQPWKETASSSGAVMVRCHAQGHLDTRSTQPGIELATFRLPANRLSTSLNYMPAIESNGTSALSLYVLRPLLRMDPEASTGSLCEIKV